VNKSKREQTDGRYFDGWSTARGMVMVAWRRCDGQLQEGRGGGLQVEGSDLWRNEWVWKLKATICDVTNHTRLRYYTRFGDLRRRRREGISY